MGNCAICYGNQADDATLSTGSWEATLPLDNLKTSNPKKVARTTNDANSSTKFRFELPADVPVGCLGLRNTNASVAAQFRWKLYSDAYITEAYSSGIVDLYPAGSMPFGSIPWGAPNWWSGAPTVPDVEHFQRNLFHVLSQTTYARYGEFELFDTANPDNFFEAGRLFIGEVFQPAEMNMEMGVSIQVKSRTEVNRARGGAKFFNPLTPDFSIPFSMPRLTELEAMRLLDMQAQTDVHGEVLFIWDPDDVEYWFRKSLFGQFAQLDPIRHPQFENWATAFQVEGNK